MIKQLLLAILAITTYTTMAQSAKKVLVFTKTAGFRHTSIAKGIDTFRVLCESNGMDFAHTEDAAFFLEPKLNAFDLVVFLNTTENIFNAEEQKAFKAYIENGGNFMGVHSATDTEYDWPWYGALVGAYFDGHPEPQYAELNPTAVSHLSTRHLKKRWLLKDEWYNFKNLSDKITVVLSLREASYSGGTNGELHPMAWYQELGRSRCFYTALGHSEALYDNPDFQQHLLGGIKYCLGITD